MSDWSAVGRTLLGRWPEKVARWGREGLEAYCDEMAAVGVRPEAAIIALRSWEETWPPSGGELVGLVRRDPSLPTFEEAWVLIRRSLSKAIVKGVFKEPADMRRAENEAVLAALDGHHPAIRSFVERQRVDHLRNLEVDDPQWGEKRMTDLRAAWDRHIEASDRRQVAALASGDRDGLRQLDPLASLGVGVAGELTSGGAA